MKKTVYFLLIAVLAVIMVQCNNKKSSKEFDSAYICSMHCEGSGSEKAGKCPVCGMEYIKNKKTNK